MSRLIDPDDVVVKGEDGWYMHGHVGHTVFVPNDGRWTFNGNFKKPTFTPSINENPKSKFGHHFFITDGVIHYLSDSRRMQCCEGTEEYYTIPKWRE